jgi:hypothetical protein
MYPTMNNGQRHEFVSRRTIATVDMHCIASTKKTINVNAVRGVQTVRPASSFAFRTAEMSVSDCSFSSLPTL